MAKLLLISGSLRDGSTNSATLRTAAALAPDGVETAIYDGMGRLPHFNPDDDPTDGVGLDPEPAALRTALAEADALLLSTPEYAGALPGSFKNLLDWTVGGGQTYGMPVAWLNVSGAAAPTGGADAHESLRKVLGYTGARIVEDACVRLPLSREDVGEDGLVAPPEARERIVTAVRALADAVDAGG
ncbi:MAG TPA: NAD(P)H-dependent oxidoreductase [Solirubrobacterales bacterium]|nr:NAD(P)H-dependent oxidoreductase [Solirubrobacterales bacterium]